MVILYEEELHGLGVIQLRAQKTKGRNLKKEARIVGERRQMKRKCKRKCTNETRMKRMKLW